MAQEQYGNKMMRDTKSAVKAAKETAKNVKTAKKAIQHLLSGNVGGAIAELIKNPGLGLMVVFLIIPLCLILLLFPIIFLIALPASILTGAGDAEKATANEPDSWFTDNADFNDDLKTFYSQLQQEGTDPTFSTDIASADEDGYSTYWSTANMEMSVINNYFERSYNNAVKRAQQTVQNIADQKRAEAEADGIESEYITVSTSIDSQTQTYQEIAYYIIACDSAVYSSSTTDNDQTYAMTRMMEKAQELEPNALIDAIGTALHQDVYQIWLVSENITSTDGTYEEKIPQYHQEWNEETEEWEDVPTLDDNGEQVYDIKEHRTRNYNITYSISLNPDFQDKIMSSYPELDGVQPSASGVSNIRDVIETNVEILREMFPASGTATGGGTASGGGGSALTDAEREELLALLDGTSTSPQLESVLSVIQQIIAGGDMNAAARALGITVEDQQCQAFVATLYQAAGQERKYYGSAIGAFQQIGIADTTSTPPNGATVYCTSSSPYGHVGIYFNGKVMDCWGTGVHVYDFEYWKHMGSYNYIGWGTNGWV